jgi:DNA polymerase-3 subunit epsilon
MQTRQTLRGDFAGVSVPTRRPDRSAGAWQRAVAWAAELAERPDAVYLDTETTGLGTDDEVVDIALVGAGGEVLLDTLVRPTRPISTAARAIHGLTDVDVAAAPTWDRVYPRLREIVGGRVVVVYNADFDRRLIGQCCTRWGLAEVTADWQCAMRAYADFFGEPGRGGGFRWHPLDRAVRTFGAMPGGHRALADALACRAVVLGMAAMAGERGDN